MEGCDSFRDASFSYLRSDHEQQSLTNPRGSTATRTSFGLERPKKSTDHEAEISVFGAERYFNMPISASENDSNSMRLNLHRRSVDDHLHHRPGTPCSEGSWTSRSTALLLKSSSAKTEAVLATSASRKSASYGCFRTRRRLVSGSRSFFATLGCTGTCSDDKSAVVADGQQKAAVVVDSNSQFSRETNYRLRYDARSTKRAEEHFAFPILNTASSTDENSSKSTAVVVAVADAGAEEEPPRMSLEVFGSKTGNDVVDEVAMNLERKLSVLTWDAIPSAQPYKTLSPKSATSVGRHDDLDSDASSDLFEIENMVVTSAAARRGPGLKEEEGCGAGPMSSLPCGYHYEPSEASIEWSVVTASCGGGAWDPGSDYDEKKLSANRKPPIQHKARRAGGGGILGCKSQKSVRVAENAHTTS